MDDERLEFELDALDWIESEYAENSEWLPKDSIPDTVFAAMQARGKLVTEEWSYYLSKKGNLTRYSKEGPL